MKFFKKVLKDIKQVEGKGATSALGVDFGSSSIKVVSLRKDDGQISLDNYGEIALGPYADKPVGEVANLSTEKTSAALSDLLDTTQLQIPEEAAAAVPLSGSLVIPLTIAASERDNLDNLVPQEVKKYIPVPLTDVYLDWQLSPNDEKDDSISVLAFVINKEVVENFTAALQTNGLNTDFYELEIFSVIRSAVEKGAEKSLIVDLGAKYLKIYGVKSADIASAEKVLAGSAHITEAIAKEYKIEFKEAEDIKRNLDLMSLENTEMKKFLYGKIDRVIASIQQMQRKLGYGNNVPVYISGGGILLTGLPEYVADKLDQEVIISQPFANVAAPEFLNSLLVETGPEYTVATGLALRHLIE